MVAPIPEHKFSRLVRDHSCIRRASSKEYEVITKDGQFVCNIAISHKKGSKREVKPIYVKRFLQAIDMIKKQSANEE